MIVNDLVCLCFALMLPEYWFIIVKLKDRAQYLDILKEYSNGNVFVNRSFKQSVIVAFPLFIVI